MRTLSSSLRSTVLGPLLHVHKGGYPRGVRRLESVAPEYIAELTKTVPAYDAYCCIRALEEEIALYRKLREPYLDKMTPRKKAELAAVTCLDMIQAFVTNENPL